MDATTFQQYARDFLTFARDLTIPSAHGPARFGGIMADFQVERYEALAPALLSVAKGEKPPIGRYWWEATKGASKDSDLAIALLWLLTFSPRSLDCQIGAADRDQAGELRKAAKDILRLNSWLSRFVTIDQWKITNPRTESVAEIIPADVAGSHGARPDVLILNELSHVTKEEFASNLLDNASKVPHGLVCIATNAGFTGSWQFQHRQLAMQSDRWYFHKVDFPSPWLDAAEIEEARQRNTAARYNRLWWGVWASGSGDALNSDDIEAAITLAGPLDRDEPLDHRFLFTAGLDLGISRDHAAFVVLGARRGSPRIRLCDAMSWAPPRGGKIDLIRVFHSVLMTVKKYQPMRVVHYDPFQAEMMAQHLRRNAVVTEPMNFVGKNLDLMACTLIEVFSTRTIDLYRHEPLIRDLSRLTIEEKSYGYKLTSSRDSDGHADLATALAIALPAARELSHFAAYGDLDPPTTMMARPATDVGAAGFNGVRLFGSRHDQYATPSPSKF